MRGPEQRNLYSKRRYEPGFMSLAAYNTLQHEIRRHVTGVLNFECVLLEEVHGIESCLNFIYTGPLVRLFIGRVYLNFVA